MFLQYDIDGTGEGANDLHCNTFLKFQVQVNNHIYIYIYLFMNIDCYFCLGGND